MLSHTFDLWFGKPPSSSLANAGTVCIGRLCHSERLSATLAGFAALSITNLRRVPVMQLRLHSLLLFLLVIDANNECCSQTLYFVLFCLL